MSHFTVEIFTPGRVVSSEIQADSLLVPSKRGQINILPEHTHLITELDIAGVLHAVKADNSERKFFISTGICKVLGNKVTILAEAAEEDHEIDVARAKKSHEDAKEKLQGIDPLTDHDLDYYRNKISKALTRTNIAK